MLCTSGSATARDHDAQCGLTTVKCGLTTVPMRQMHDCAAVLYPLYNRAADTPVGRCPCRAPQMAMFDPARESLSLSLSPSLWRQVALSLSSSLWRSLSLSLSLSSERDRARESLSLFLCLSLSPSLSLSLSLSLSPFLAPGARQELTELPVLLCCTRCITELPLCGARCTTRASRPRRASSACRQPCKTYNCT
jgi:hypothetical protein